MTDHRNKWTTSPPIWDTAATEEENDKRLARWMHQESEAKRKRRSVARETFIMDDETQPSSIKHTKHNRRWMHPAYERGGRDEE